MVNINSLIIKLKLYLNIDSDSKLCTFLGKSNNYLSKCKTSNNIDISLIIDKCPDIDFNWLLSDDPDKKRKIIRSTDRTDRDVIDLNDIDTQKNIKIKELEDKTKLLEMLVNALQKKE